MLSTFIHLLSIPFLLTMFIALMFLATVFALVENKFNNIATIFCSLTAVVIFVFVLMGISSIAKADQIDDLKAQSKASYCSWRAGHTVLGVLGRLHGYPLVFTNDRKENGFHITLEGGSERDIALIKRDVELGWRTADEYVKKHPDTKSDDFDGGRMLQNLVKLCLTEIEV